MANKNQAQAQAQAPAQAGADVFTQALADMPVLSGTLAGQNIAAEARKFSTGSRGWYAGGKITLPSGQRVQVSLSAVLIGSKP